MMDFYGTHASVLVSSRLIVVVHVPIPASDKKTICCDVVLDDDVGCGEHNPLADQRRPAKSLFPRRVKDGAHVGPLSKVGFPVFELLDLDVDAANMALATFWLIHWERGGLGFKIWVFGTHTCSHTGENAKQTYECESHGDSL